MAKIKASTLLRHPESGEIVFLREGENAPAWAAKLITNPGVHPQPKADEPEADGTQNDPKGAEADGAQDEGDESSDDKTGEETSDKEPAPTGRRAAAKK